MKRLRLTEPSERASAVLLGVIVVVATTVALAWVFYIPILEAPDETVHFEYSAALYGAGGLIEPRNGNQFTVPAGRPFPNPPYFEDQSAVAVIAEKPAQKAPAAYGSSAYYAAVDRGAPAPATATQFVDPPLLRYYPFGYYLLDAALMGVTASSRQARSRCSLPRVHSLRHCWRSASSLLMCCCAASAAGARWR